MAESKVFILNQEPSVANHFIAELRDVNLQRDSMRFRRNLERLGEILAYKVSAQLSYRTEAVQTPLALTAELVLEDYPVLATVLRAGLPFHQGFLNYLDYLVAPSLVGKVLLLVDPMLATGKSLALTYKAMLRFGTPRQVHLAAAIASPEGVAHIQAEVPEAHIWLGALDERLDDRFYIVPGLGDAGDLAFGAKI
jgi:uracil phosphoribosyltransferase